MKIKQKGLIATGGRTGDNDTEIKELNMGRNNCTALKISIWMETAIESIRIGWVWRNRKSLG